MPVHGSFSSQSDSTSSSLVARVKAHDPADVSQEVFRAVAARIESFRRDNAQDTFRGWLWTITRNKVGDFLRRSAREPQALGGSDALARLNEMPESFSESTPAAAPPADDLLHRALALLRNEFEPAT